MRAPQFNHHFYRPDPESKPVFVVGMARSGTTLLRLILHRSSNLAMLSETWFGTRVWDRRWEFPMLEPVEPFRSRLFDSFISLLKGGERDDFPLDFGVVRERFLDGDPHLNRMLSALGEVWAETEGKPRWGEKTPKHTLYLSVLADMFPSMRAVCIVRDPRDVVVSNLEAGFAESMGPLTAALEWRESVIAARRFAAGSPGTMAFVSYEDLVSEAAPAIMDVCGHVGVSFEEQMLRPHDIAERYAPKQSWMRGLDEPITSRRVRRWPGLLDRDTLATIEALNFEEMVACGYHPESSPRRLRHAKTFVRPLLEAMDEWASVKSARRSDVVELKRGAYRDLLEQIGG